MSTEAKIPEADLKNVNLKPTETVEKVILPSAEGKFAAENAGEISPGNRQNVRDFTSGTPIYPGFHRVNSLISIFRC